MQTEIEAKFLNIDFDDIRSRLRQADAILEQPMRLMKRVTIETPSLKNKNMYLRVRDEGDKITLTLKQHTGDAIDEAKEIDIVVSDFKKTVELLKYLDLPYRSFQETKRETWKLDGAEIVLDEWPWLNPYLEIEANSEKDVKNCAAKLNLDWNEAVFGDVMVAYQAQYPHLTKGQTIGDVPELKFDAPMPNLLLIKEEEL